MDSVCLRFITRSGGCIASRGVPVTGSRAYRIKLHEGAVMDSDGVAEKMGRSAHRRILGIEPGFTHKLWQSQARR